MEAKRILCPLLLSFALIVAVPARDAAFAESLEENIDAELDDAMDIADPSGASAPAKKKKEEPKKKPAPEQSSAASDEELDLDDPDEGLALEDEDSLDEPMETAQAAESAEPAKSAEPVKPQAAAPSEPPAAAPAPELEPESEFFAQPEPIQASSPVAETISSDEPNMAFEQRLHRIFQNNGQPISDERWSELLGNRRDEAYAVQAGDTLWDISKTFFGDGFFWSKLWAENRGIENPHKIVPGKALRFIGGTEQEAPSVQVTEVALIAQAGPGAIMLSAPSGTTANAPVYREEVEKSLSPADLEAGLVEEDEVIPRPVIPPAPASTQVLKRLPASFALPPGAGNVANYDRTGLDARRPKAFTKPPVVILNSFISDSDLVRVGIIEEIEGGEKVASIGQNVFVKIARSASSGDRFAVYYPKEKINDKVRGNVGPVVEVGGMVEIREVMNESKGIYRAMVTLSVNPIRLGAYLSDEPLPKAEYKRSGSIKDISVRILGGEFDERRQVLGEGAVIYTDGGSRVGMQEGDILAVQAHWKERNSATKVPDVLRPVALIKVIKVFPTVATAVVLRAEDVIVPGDKTGGMPPKGADLLRDESLGMAEPGANKEQTIGDEEIDF